MKLFAVVVLAAALTACGGGGGGSSPVPSGPSKTPLLNAGFAQTSGPASQSQHRITLAIAPEQGTLNGAVLPIANFWIPDSYIAAGTYPSTGESEVAYVTGESVPSPLPAVTFTTASGPALTVLATPSPLPIPAGLPSGATIIAGQIVGPGSQTGQTTIAVSAMSQTAQITANTYPGLDLDTGGAWSTGATGLTFTSAGAAPTTSGTPDLSIDTSQSVSALTAPSGIVEVEKTVDQIQPSDFVQANAVTTLRDVNLCNIDGVVRSFIFKTAAGALVKFQPISIGGSNVAQGVCTFDDIRGPYQVAGSNGFAF